MSQERKIDPKAELKRKVEEYYNYAPVKPMGKRDWVLLGILLAVGIGLLVLSGTVMLHWYYP